MYNVWRIEKKKLWQFSRTLLPRRARYKSTDPRRNEGLIDLDGYRSGIQTRDNGRLTVRRLPLHHLRPLCFLYARQTVVVTINGII
nr:unnamed protein product [Haemonchus contortus]